MTTTAKGAGSLRQRRPGVWEIRVAAGTAPVTGRVIQRSVTFHGNAAEAEASRRDLAGEYRQRRAATRAAPLLTIGELLARWLLADHPGIDEQRGLGVAEVVQADEGQLSPVHEAVEGLGEGRRGRSRLRRLPVEYRPAHRRLPRHAPSLTPHSEPPDP